MSKSNRLWRLQRRIQKLQYRQEENHVPSSSPGNPYWKCKECGVHDPELSIRGGKHFGRCSIEGLAKEIDHYKRLVSLEEVAASPIKLEQPAKEMNS
jgi:hypothetical protein